ncbi:MAG: 3-isopropylmalate dehydrogenase [Alphaproteobacteria bacterium GM202ARS2]|nr:3-isopropylmalate dehydrogenase [Alphaproteobacteria bacterium GM202ARS2]
MSGRLVLLPGDGIGPEVVKSACCVLEHINSLGRGYTTEEDLVGGAAYEAHGVPLHADTLARAKQADAVLLGAVGGPQWESLPFDKRPERGLLALRKELDLFANLRPAIVFDALAGASTLKPEVVKGLDILIVRELTGGIYFGEPRGVDKDAQGRIGRNTLVYHEDEIRRVVRLAFDMARLRNKRVCSVDKANVLECTELWRDVTNEVHKDYQDVALTHMYVDNAAMQLVRAPAQFDVMVTTNMFGDILSDEASMLTGSLGMLPSASLGASAEDVGKSRPGLYEPVHGSAPDIAGMDKANPLATILSLALLLRYSFHDEGAARAIEQSVERCLAEGYRCADIDEGTGACLGTQAMGEKVAGYLETFWT